METLAWPSWSAIWACGQFSLVEQRGAGLAEDVAGDPGELAAATSLAKLA
jgi:hypothetical protein